MRLYPQQKKYKATGLLGLMAHERHITGIDEAIIHGSYFVEDDEESCLLSMEMADGLGIGVEDVGQKKVQIFGRYLVVRGLFDAELFEAINDLDYEPLTPADFQLSSSQVLGAVGQEKVETLADEDNSEIKPFVHLNPANVLVMPFGTLREIGGTLRSVAVHFDNSINITDIIVIIDLIIE